MQVMGVTGRIYGLKSAQTANGKDKVTFRIGVRKQYVSDQDKQDGKTMTFMPMIAMGPTAKFITTYFKEGDNIAIGSMEFQTFRSQNADPSNTFDDMYNFKIDKAGFVRDGQQPADQAAPQQRQQTPPPQQQPQYNQAPPQYNQAPPQYNQAPPQQQQAPQYQAAGVGNDPFQAGAPTYVSDDDLPF